MTSKSSTIVSASCRNVSASISSRVATAEPPSSAVTCIVRHSTKPALGMRHETRAALLTPAGSPNSTTASTTRGALLNRRVR